MPQLFSRTSNSAIRVVLFVGIVGALATPVILMGWARTPYYTGQDDPVEQPIPFDHRHHVRDDGIDCMYCHYLAKSTPYAGVPPTSVCLNCHAQIWSQSAFLQPVWNSYLTGRPIRWRRINSVPDFVYFDHSIHVRKGVGCETCHGRVDLMGRVYQARPLNMGWCLECHRDPAKYLRPVEDVTEMGYEPARPQSVLGPMLMKKYNVRSRTDCTTCHR